jgi:hypothetical protein
MVCFALWAKVDRDASKLFPGGSRQFIEGSFGPFSARGVVL